MSELKPCPFCGGEAEIEPVYDFKSDVPSGYFVWCHGNDCVVEPMTEDFKTEADAIKAWNNRVERTCECVAEYAKSPIDGKTIVLHRCSACHELMRPHMAYCPSCGARVIESD